MSDINEKLNELEKTVLDALSNEELIKSANDRIEQFTKSLEKLNEDIEVVKEVLSKALDRIERVENYVVGRRSASADDQVNVKKTSEEDPKLALYKSIAQVAMRTFTTNQSQKLDLG
jgi:predicted  nucleic acid-binding Zn-ribbon protein